MTHQSEEKLREFFKKFAGAATRLLLLDYDGTLAPFRVDRFQAAPWAGVRGLLNQIQAQGKTQLQVVSGRPAGEIVELLKLDTPPTVWGLHGAERLNPDGGREMETTAHETRARLDALSATLRNSVFGGLFEEKLNAAVVHWRGMAPRKAREVEQRTRALFEPLAHMDGLQLLEFERGLELRAGRDKGGAVTAILQEFGAIDSMQFPAADLIPAAYLGDDITDESAFAAIEGRGLGVLVRREWRATRADVWLKPPEELRSFLGLWLDAGA